MPRQRDQERTAARREAITLAAARLFAERGFENTSASEIAKAAGLSSGSIFYYFADKRSVLRSVFERDLPARQELVERSLAYDDPVAGLLAMVDEIAAEAMDPLAPGILVEVLRQAPKDPELMRVIGQTAEVTKRCFAELIQRGIRSGAIDPKLDPVETAGWIEIVIDGAFLNADPHHDPRPMLRRIVTRLLAETSEEDR